MTRFVNISLKESRETMMLMKFKSICNLYDLSLGEYLVNKYALWLDFRVIDENELHRMGRRIENASEGITLQIEKKSRISWGSKCLHLPNHGCSVKHPKWHIRFCRVLD